MGGCMDITCRCFIFKGFIRLEFIHVRLSQLDALNGISFPRPFFIYFFYFFSFAPKRLSPLFAFLDDG